MIYFYKQRKKNKENSQLTEAQAHALISNSLDTPIALYKILELNGYFDNGFILFQSKSSAGPDGSIIVGKAETKDPWRLFLSDKLTDFDIYLMPDGQFVTKDKRAIFKPVGLKFNYLKYLEDHPESSSMFNRVNRGKNIQVNVKKATDVGRTSAAATTNTDQQNTLLVQPDKEDIKPTNLKGKIKKQNNLALLMGLGVATAAVIGVIAFPWIALGITATSTAWWTYNGEIPQRIKDIGNAFGWLKGVLLRDGLPEWTVDSVTLSVNKSNDNVINSNDFEYMTIVFHRTKENWFSIPEVCIGKPPINKKFVYDKSLYSKSAQSKIESYAKTLKKPKFGGAKKSIKKYPKK